MKLANEEGDSEMNVLIKRIGLSFLALAAIAWFAYGCSTTREPARVGLSTSGTVADPYSYASGTSGTYTVPAGYYVTSWWAHNTTSGGTVTITATSPNWLGACYDAGVIDAGDGGVIVLDGGPCVGPGTTITIPAGTQYQQTVPTLVGVPDELGSGTVFVFTSTDSYVVTLRQNNR
jgi:hypothetical protein